ncbi:DNA-binding NarL/FixJ family response regulator [Flavobacterium arsenatis]|uniref:DNA-binding NarL/FixJ family response regulator n=1 Tax=Flavobacterium arsenatis TaxID=1484332 RepID=A0ABU1TQG5_9FLAO|nr:DNA-binding response regulator [Flavobacterium arsenatis]MDR6968209.1 DNA-binding NarL/FixJ family response regulator [Flavobacterium arsenatis]
MNILIVDDHPMTVSGYIESLSLAKLLPQPLMLYKAYTCEEAFQKSREALSLELAIIDYGLPAYETENLHSGSDVAIMIRQQHPNCKIVMITAHTEILLVYGILKSVQPDGLLLKNEITPENLPLIVQQILIGNPFQSSGARHIIREIWKKDLLVDDVNREILLYLSKGYKIKKIETVLSLSISAIQRRISMMKDAFDVKEDSSLVEEAFLNGFL